MNINGVILTERAIMQLKALQDEENSLLKNNIRELHTAVKFIINETMFSSDAAKKANSVLLLCSCLYSICDAFENLYAVDNEAD